MNYWIQRHDYSSEDFEAESHAEIAKAFSDYDWEPELESFTPDDDEKIAPWTGNTYL